MLKKKEIIVVILILLGIVGVYAGIALLGIHEREKDEKRQKELDGQSFLQIVNNTDHDVNVAVYYHEGGKALVERYHLSPHHLVRYKEDIESGELGIFFRHHPIDSALLVFDDTINYWQVPSRADMFNKHYLYREYDGWKSTQITIREASRKRIGLYRYGRQYVIGERDYEAALGIKRYNGTIIRENKSK